MVKELAVFTFNYSSSSIDAGIRKTSPPKNQLSVLPHRWRNPRTSALAQPDHRGTAGQSVPAPQRAAEEDLREAFGCSGRAEDDAGLVLGDIKGRKGRIICCGEESKKKREGFGAEIQLSSCRVWKVLQCGVCTAEAYQVQT